MLFSASIAAFILSTSVLSLSIPRSSQPLSRLDIKLTSAGNTRVKAVLTNKASRTLNLLKYNNLLDDGPVKKVELYKNGNPVEFDGMVRHFQTRGLPENVFVSIRPNEKIEVNFDIASTADLSAGGSYSIVSRGHIPFAEPSTTELTGVVSYDSNTLKLDIDGTAAASVVKAIPHFLVPRARLDLPTCGPSFGPVVRAALKNAAEISLKAAEAAKKNPKLFQEYFRTSNSSAVNTVARRYRAVAKEAASIDSGIVRYYCQDFLGRCTTNMLAYTLPRRNTIANCRGFYQISPLSTKCRVEDQAATVIHEITHAVGVFSPHTIDHAYGYQNLTKLTTAQALLNGDTYGLFAVGESS
ncbi:hypothetical protein LOZ39_001070 [Ophidiomyces ophidiicola]|nr:hypothetical protein LOZ64_002512 [Ophidiomyces ophidiicola]KAI2002149.1 hypothetical protein LOZ50_005199 [Ophidiomyces ophidiicola]KAI2009019.1 hypothetical protein LOZ49_004057 [Ophidiomyces ophidiicola]KAI2013167.1 hypothetical protein LOZ46_005824 [Ophidiomyces ophidiicola]KAI2064421.1 hypothetical protein LOZ40_004705 [Ophidiomyces ophidiicola]